MADKDMVEVNLRPMKLKRIITFTASIFIILLFALNAFAQQEEGGQGEGDIDLQEMAMRQTELIEEVFAQTSLVLTQSQTIQIHELNLEYAIKIKEIHEGVDENSNNGNTNENKSNIRGKLVSTMNKKDVELKKILTTEQWVELVHWRNEDRKANREKGN